MEEKQSYHGFRISIALSVVVILVFVYFYPRLILKYLEKGDPWTSYLYHYGLGLVFFSIGVWFAIKKKALQFGRGRDSFWYKIMLAGFILYAAVHGIWILLAITIPFKGAM